MYDLRTYFNVSPEMFYAAHIVKEVVCTSLLGVEHACNLREE
ncbi:hypothetical protein FHS86_002652 [Roseimarinus sediminis]